jgi:hypothetical protein
VKTILPDKAHHTGEPTTPTYTTTSLRRHKPQGHAPRNRDLPSLSVDHQATTPDQTRNCITRPVIKNYPPPSVTHSGSAAITNLCLSATKKDLNFVAMTHFALADSDISWTTNNRSLRSNQNYGDWHSRTEDKPTRQCASHLPEQRRCDHAVYNPTKDNAKLRSHITSKTR